MASNDPIAAILDQLAAHREQLARLGHIMDEHTAALAELNAPGVVPSRAPRHRPILIPGSTPGKPTFY